jgi:hypothetical protein
MSPSPFASILSNTCLSVATSIAIAREGRIIPRDAFPSRVRVIVTSTGGSPRRRAPSSGAILRDDRIVESNPFPSLSSSLASTRARGDAYAVSESLSPSSYIPSRRDETRGDV